MFSNATGWISTLVSILGALTATDTFPMVTGLLTETVGAKAAHAVGLVLTLAGLLVAKLSHSGVTPTPPTP